MKKLSITKSNILIKSSYHLSLNELRIVIYGLSFINPTSRDFPLFYEINLKHFREYFGILSNERGFYGEIKDAVLKKFWERETTYWDEKNKEVVKRRWLIGVNYKNTLMKIYFNPLLKDQLQQLKKNFTTYFLSNIVNMKSIYGIRIYELCIMEFNKKKLDKVFFTITISRLKTYFMLDKKYKRFYDFKNRVLEKAKIEILKHSNLEIVYEILKINNIPLKIRFSAWKKNTNI